MIHPHTELRFINETVGFGVVATKLIPKGSITWAHDKLDMVFSEEQVLAFEPERKETLDKYCYIDPRGNWVYCWDIAKYVNHSFNSSCISTAYDFEIAVRDIHPGEELTDDYGYLNLQEPFDCLPEKNSLNRTQVLPDDNLKFHAYWDGLLKAAFPFVSQVEQPLFKFLDPELQQKVLRISKGQEVMDSILNCYYQKNNSHVQS